MLIIYFLSVQRLSRSGSLDLAIKWDTENVPLDFSPCLLDVKQATLASRELRETGNPLDFLFLLLSQDRQQGQQQRQQAAAAATDAKNAAEQWKDASAGFNSRGNQSLPYCILFSQGLVLRG